MRSRSEYDANQALQSRAAIRQASQAWQEPSRAKRAKREAMWSLAAVTMLAGALALAGLGAAWLLTR